MKKNLIIFSKLFLFSLLFIACTKKPTLIDLDASVNITKAIDSLPCLVNVEYNDVTNGTVKESISSNWTTHRSLHSDQTGTLKATAISNVKTISIEILAKGSTVSKNCNGNNCTIEIVRNMYD